MPGYTPELLVEKVKLYYPNIGYEDLRTLAITYLEINPLATPDDFILFLNN